MDKFDDIFNKRVKEAFSNYNVDHLSDKGWKSFIARRRRKIVPGGGMPFWLKAAAVALLIAAGGIITYFAITRKTTDKTIVTASGAAPGTFATDSVAGKLPETADLNKNTGNMPLKSAEKTAVYKLKTQMERPQKVTDTEVTGKEVNRINEESLPKVAGLSETGISDAGIMDAVKIAWNEIFLELKRVETSKEIPLKDSLKIDDTELLPERYKPSLIAGISGMMAVVDNVIAGSPGFNMGFYLEHQFNKRFAVRPGLALAMHSSAIEKTAGETQFDYALPLYNGTAGNTESYNAHLNLVAIEVPLNFVFTVFDRKKSDFYLSAGASTMVYLKQQMTGKFINSYTKTTMNAATGLMESDTRYSTVEVETEEKALSHTDFFGLANISAGYSVPYGKNMRFLIEPYIQMPLKNLTSLNIKILYSGMSLRIKFGL
ncbi:MAG: outer membrane beta-barrel protein [Bacteroidales bacterium]